MIVLVCEASLYMLFAHLNVSLSALHDKHTKRSIVQL